MKVTTRARSLHPGNALPFGIVLLFSLLLAAVVAGLGSPALAQSRPGTMPEPKGNKGTIVDIQGGILTLSLAPGRIVQVSTNAGTIVLNGDLSTVASLRIGDTVMVNPHFSMPASGAQAGEDVGGRSRSAQPASRAAGRNSGDLKVGGPGERRPNTPPSPGEDGGSGGPGSSNGSSGPGDKDKPADPNPNTPPPQANEDSPSPAGPIAASIIWVQGGSDVLTAGVVQSVVDGRITLQARSRIFTVTTTSSTVYTTASGASTSPGAATSASVKLGGTLVVLGTVAGKDSPLSAKAVIIVTPPK
jgi:hypothetical protein